ncbi:MAG: hypothetical protein M1833_006509 [Piccolia ochrophora]|nr:MAG: hypothetical protein M1833_006509 [Piccolia ochrophora]
MPLPPPKAARKRQTMLNFIPVDLDGSSSPLRTPLSAGSKNKAAATEYASPSSSRRSGKASNIAVVITTPRKSGSMATSLPTPKMSSQQDIVEPRNGGQTDLHSDSEPYPMDSPPRSTSKIPFVYDATTTEQEKLKPKKDSTRAFLKGGTSGYAPISPSQRRSSKRKGKSNSSINTRELRSSKGRLNSAALSRGGRITRSSMGELGGGSRPVVISDASDSETDEAESRVSPKRANAAPSSNRNRNVTDEDDEDIILSPTKRRKTTAPAAEIVSDDSFEDSSEEDIIMHSVISKGGQKSRQRSFNEQEKADLEEDLEILGGGDVRETRTRGKGTPRRKTKKEKQLELLRRRRAGQPISHISDSASDDDGNPPRGIYDSISDSVDEEVEDDESEEFGVRHIREALRRDRNDDYDDDFVVEDDHTLGAPVDMFKDMPLHLSRWAHMKLKDYFKVAVEWMIQRKINPGFQIDDPIYDLAFRKLDDEVQGYSASKFVSSAWRSEFIRALKARPILFKHALSDNEKANQLDDKCGACNRSGHKPSYVIQFDGHPYIKETLEPVERDEDDNSEDGSEDEKGNPVAPGDTSWRVGRFCAANAESAHALEHWRFALNDWVVDYLKNADYTSAEKIVERDGWSTKKKRDYANQVVDELEQKHEIRKLYDDFKNQLNGARNAEVCRFRPMLERIV